MVPISKKYLSDLKEHELKGKKVLVRIDLDVLLDGNLIIIVDSIKCLTVVVIIKHLIAHGAKVILCGHLGCPEGVNSKYSLKPIAGKLSEILGVEVKMAKDCIGEEVEILVAEISDGGVLLLENLRFHKGEEKNDHEFAKKLASLADVYVNEAFGIADRVYASTVGVTKYLKPSVGGFFMQREVDRFYSQNVNNPNKLVVYAIVGGTLPAKSDDIKTLIKNGYNLVLGGEMMYTLFKAKGYEVGTHIVEEYEIDIAKSIINMAEDKGVTILMPSDVVIADRKMFLQVVPADRIPDGSMVVCFGPDTIKAFKEACGTAKTIIWNGPISIKSEFDKNGPISILEFDKFSPIDDVISNVLADLSAKGVTVIIGGDETIAAVEKVGVAKQMSHISSGFGAGLEILAGKRLPAVCALDDDYTPIPFKFSKLFAGIGRFAAAKTA